MKFDRPIAIAITLFAAILIAVFLVYPEYKKFKSLQSELGVKKAEFNAEYDYFSAITKTYYDIQSHGDNIQKIDDALPTDPTLGKLIYYFQKTASENGLMLKSLYLSRASAAGQGKINDLVFSLNLLGEYSSLENFLKSLERSSRLFEVTTISFGTGSSAQNYSQSQFQSTEALSFNLEIKTHSY